MGLGLLYGGLLGGFWKRVWGLFVVGLGVGLGMGLVV